LLLSLALGIGLDHYWKPKPSASIQLQDPADPPKIPLHELVHPQQFYLDSSWNVNAPPTVRIFNWSTPFFRFLPAWTHVVLVAITEVMSQPGGLWKRMLVVNNQSPGPVIEANFGDRLIVCFFCLSHRNYPTIYTV
jgi:hypothetical protein